MCKIGYYFPDVDADANSKYFNGTTLEEEYMKMLEVSQSQQKIAVIRPGTMDTDILGVRVQ